MHCYDSLIKIVFILSIYLLRTYCTPNTIPGSGDYMNKMFLEFVSNAERQTIKKINGMLDGDACSGRRKDD